MLLSESALSQNAASPSWIGFNKREGGNDWRWSDNTNGVSFKSNIHCTPNGLLDVQHTKEPNDMTFASQIDKSALKGQTEEKINFVG